MNIFFAWTVATAFFFSWIELRMRIFMGIEGWWKICGQRGFLYDSEKPVLWSFALPPLYSKCVLDSMDVFLQRCKWYYVCLTKRTKGTTCFIIWWSEKNLDACFHTVYKSRKRAYPVPGQIACRPSLLSARGDVTLVKVFLFCGGLGSFQRFLRSLGANLHLVCLFILEGVPVLWNFISVSCPSRFYLR